MQSVDYPEEMWRLAMSSKATTLAVEGQGITHLDSIDNLTVPQIKQVWNHLLQSIAQETVREGKCRLYECKVTLLKDSTRIAQTSWTMLIGNPTRETATLKRARSIPR